jgi:hypothetical protein
MKPFYIFAVVSLLYFNGNAQPASTPVDTTTASCVKQLFDYLLKSSRLNTTRQDSVTVQDLARDANNAGYNINVSACAALRNNLSSLFYTVTPKYVSLAGMLMAPPDSAYIAMIGNYRLRFSNVNGMFEHMQHSFYSKPCSKGDTIEYTLYEPVTHYHRYTIRHYAKPDSMDWSVSYTDTNGLNRIKRLKARDSIFTVPATAVSLVQDIDTINLIYSGSWCRITKEENDSFTVNPASYFRPTNAVLSFQRDPARIVKTNFTVKAGPNPSFSSFHLTVSSATTEAIMVRLMDSNGRPVEIIKANSTANITLGKNLQKGIYYAEVLQGDRREVVKLIRL